MYLMMSCTKMHFRCHWRVPIGPANRGSKWSMKALKLIFALHNHTNHTDNSAS
jgi:hypothetical protein